MIFLSVKKCSQRRLEETPKNFEKISKNPIVRNFLRKLKIFNFFIFSQNNSFLRGRQTIRKKITVFEKETQKYAFFVPPHDASILPSVRPSKQAGGDAQYPEGWSTQGCIFFKRESRLISFKKFQSFKPKKKSNLYIH